MESFTSILIPSISLLEGWNYSGSTLTLVDYCHGKLINYIDLYYHKSSGN